MKATGIIRRIDDLGRVVIPKEIRRTLKIREGDPLEIFIEDNDCVCFKRYSMPGSLTKEALQTAITMASKSGLRPIAIYDTTVKLRGMENFPPYVPTQWELWCLSNYRRRRPCGLCGLRPARQGL